MPDADEDWRFTLEDLESDEESESNVAGSFLPDDDLTPGKIDLENALFVALGAIAAGLVLVAFALALT